MSKLDKSDELLRAVHDLRLALTGESNQETSSAHLGFNRCKSKQSLTRMCFWHPTIMLPAVGTKTVLVGDNEFVCRPGSLLQLPAGVSFDVENAPDSKLAYYMGIAVRFDPETFRLFVELYGSQFDTWNLTPQWHVTGKVEPIVALVDWIRWTRRFSPEVTQIRHRMVEVLLLFAQHGLAGNLLMSHHRSWRQKVKELVALDPARDWQIDAVCRKLGASESTLRRHLRTEDSSFRALLEEVRLEKGMGLVMESDMPISQISLACGYLSQSRFAERFRLRFSVTPIELRNTRNESQSPRDNVVRISSMTRG